MEFGWNSLVLDFTEPMAGQEVAFVAWHTGVHLPGVLRKGSATAATEYTRTLDMTNLLSSHVTLFELPQGDPTDAATSMGETGEDSSLVQRSRSVRVVLQQSRTRQTKSGKAPLAEATLNPDCALFFVFANAVAGKEREFHEWNDDTHLAEVIAHPEVRAGVRYDLISGPDWIPGRFVSIYEFESDDPLRVLEELKQAPRAPADEIDRLSARQLIITPLAARRTGAGM